MSQDAFQQAPAPGLICPQCLRPLPSDARVCPNCGVDLALIALLAERTYLEGLPAAAPIAATPEAVVPRIGEFLLEQGLISEAQLQRALVRQSQLAAQGAKRLLGQTLLEMGFLDRETLDRAVTRQIIELHAALQDSNRTLERRVSERTIELRRALERMTELNQLKANLVSNVSHELRTPLAHIKGYVELLASANLGPLSPEQDSALGVIRRALDRLERLIEDLIEFSSASREGLQLRIQPVELARLARGSIERSRDKSIKAGVRLETDVPEGLPPILADAERLGWVLFQLVDNGVKFTPDGGAVTIGAKRDGPKVTVFVQDTGIGIPIDRQAELFEPFHQLDGSTTRRYGGTGLGLALVRQILDAHGTKITVQSEEGAGSTFSFSLPLADSS
jgi:signal transduction histidine kinase